MRGAAAWASVLGAAGALLAQGPDWDAIAGPTQAKWPAAGDEVRWREDLGAAFAEARATGRPLFVTLRCLPCKQCAAFDQDVLEGGERLAPLLSRFVTVRLTDAAAIDLARLPAAGYQDFDLSWWGYLLSPEARLYSVFGGRDHVSDATRISEAALANTLRRVLDHHYDPRRADWAIDGPAVAADAPVRSPKSLPGFASFREHSADFHNQTCLHCHQVGDILRQPAVDAGTFDKLRDTAIWPLPENVGLTVDRDDGLLVTDVRAHSPAAAIGVRRGDRLLAAGGRRLFGQADLRGVLHRNADPAGRIALQWLRDGGRHAGPLELAAGWRDTVLDWRMSISQGNIGAGPTFFPLASRHPRAPTETMAVQPFFGRDAGKRAAFRAGLRPGHCIVAVDGEQPRLTGRAFLVWFRKRCDPGQRVVFTVLDRDGERDIPVELPR